MQEIESIKEFGGTLKRFQHFSTSCNCEMTFSVFLPEQSQQQGLPSLYYLSGLTCTDDNVRSKAGAARYAAEHGIVFI
ncbi:MAG: alpha/beta hydrolase-fold protein, partial [Pseudomonadales bacterium]